MIAPVFDEAGAVTHFLRMSEDVTDQKKAQLTTQAVDSQRRQSERIESVGRLAGGVAHDFNNLLTVVIGHAHLVLQQLPPHDPLRSDVGAVLDAASRGGTITRQLLTYARRDVVHPLVLDPAQAIAALARLLQRLAGDEIRLGFSLGPEVWPVRIDPSQFDQMVTSLAANAPRRHPWAGRDRCVARERVAARGRGRRARRTCGWRLRGSARQRHRRRYRPRARVPHLRAVLHDQAAR